MAAGRDEVDFEEARRLAWQVPQAGARADVVARPADAYEEHETALRTRVAAVCGRLRTRMASACALPAGTPERDAAVDALLALVSDLDLELVGLRDEPEAARLARLYLEGRARMSAPARRRTMLAMIHGFLGYMDPADVPDLVAAAARAEDMDLAVSLDRALRALPERAAARLGRQMARLLEAGTPGQRLLAAYVLAERPSAPAADALRAALEQPSAQLRVLCLRALLRLDDGLRPQDVLRLAQDALAHGVYWRRDEDDSDDLGAALEDALLQAFRRVRPPGLAAVLERGLHPPDGGRMRTALGAAFFERALAAVAPETVLAGIDTELGAHWAGRIRAALPAAALLPEDLARPRLFAAARDVRLEVSQRARELWRSAFGPPEPPPPDLGPLAVLASGAPSESCALRLQVLAGPPEGAAALAKALLAEAPRGESLALLLHWLAASAGSPEVEGLPRGSREWASELARRFGADELVRALLLLVSRPDTLETALELLLSLVEAGLLPPGARDAVCDAAARAANEDTGYTTVSLLQALGPRRRDWPVLLPRALCRRDDDDGAEDSDPTAERARKALAALGRCPALNAEILRRIRNRPASDRHLADLAELAVARHLRKPLPLLLEYLESCDPSRSWFSYVRIGRALYKAGVVDARWIRRRLRRPEEAFFGVAAWIESPHYLPGARRLLQAAMNSPARDGRAALEALWPLLATWAVRPRRVRARTAQILASAPEEAVLWFFESMHHRPCSTTGQAAAFVRLLASADPRIAREALLLVWYECGRRKQRICAAALPKIRVESVRQDVLEELGLERTDEYWAAEPELPSALADGAPEPAAEVSADDDEDDSDDSDDSEDSGDPEDEWYDEAEDPVD